MTDNPKHAAEWWRGAFLYQIYPKSFCDTNNDGMGDLPGITQNLEYVADLGVDGIWISPFFKSPMKDFGYDVSDYRDVDPIFGTLDDFDALLEKAHSLDLKIIIDLVLSHTSDQHPWFHDESKKDWYVWADPKEGGSPPNNWVSVFGGSAWEFDERYGQYYLHNFLKEQPDLNFHNPAVQEAVLDIARFWLDKGVDGFRLDVVNFYFHHKGLHDNPPRDPMLGPATQFEGDDPYSEQAHVYDKSQPENLIFIERFRALMDEYDDRFTVGEVGDDNPYTRSAEYTKGHTRLNTTYNTHMMSGTRKGLTADTIRWPMSKIEKYKREFHGGWPCWAFSNHDVVRAVSRWLPGSENFGHDPRLAKMLTVLLGTLSGTVFMYQGEELGLPEAELQFEDLQDPWGKSLWPKWQGRDGCRTPMPWSAQKPENSWLPMPDEHAKLSVENQKNDPRSVLNFTKTFIKWRKNKQILHIGTIEFIETNDPYLLAFKRILDDEVILCVFNMEESPKTMTEYNIGLGPFGFHIDGFESE